METFSRNGKAAPPPEGVVKCVFCRDPIPFADVTKFDRVCKLCACEIEEFGWRTVYDRELNVGQIPTNLRAAYKL